MAKRKTLAGAALAALAALPSMAQEPAPPMAEHVFTVTANLGEAVPVGETAYGKRNIIPITGGTVEGPGINGTIVPGAWDWQLTRGDGCTVLKADYMIKSDDGAVINVVNQATVCPPEEGAEPARVITRPVMEPPLGKYAWLGKGTFLGLLEIPQDSPVPQVRIRIYRIK